MGFRMTMGFTGRLLPAKGEKNVRGELQGSILGQAGRGLWTCAGRRRRYMVAFERFQKDS